LAEAIVSIWLWNQCLTDPGFGLEHVLKPKDPKRFYFAEGKCYLHDFRLHATSTCSSEFWTT